jgi:hypothetical protein
MKGTRFCFAYFFVALLGLTLAFPVSARAEDVLSVASRLAHQNLPYLYGSDDLRKGGLDCSGFVQLVFRKSCGIDLPNEADKQLDYCRAHGQVWDATSGWTPETLQPGDLIFFAGPYDLPRESRIIHVMIYGGQETMMGAQGIGRQVDGVLGGVGDYYFHPRIPNGILGESGERFIGHRRVFAYGRLPVGRVPVSINSVASAQSLPID